MSIAGLIVFDVDGTLLRGKTICELIAERIGKSERMAWLERNDASAYGDADSLISAREEMANWYLEAGRTATERFITGAKRYLGRNVSTVESYRAGVMLWTPSPISWIIKAENIATLRRAA